jgi:uncharacterized protein YdhG (YjbR/CyaY superfamily)
MATAVISDFETYLSGFPNEIQTRLKQVRASIKKAAPKAEESISYRMPAFKYKGILVWIAAHKNHIGLYPKASGIAAFRKELSVYKMAKGSVQFPFDKPLPLGLIIKIVKFRLKENEQNASGK